MDYIFTESFLDIIKFYTSVNIIVDNVFSSLLSVLGEIAPYFIRYTVGYCPFFYQISYGVAVYIYIYRRYRAKKLNNWKSFYGNSISNWLIFNLSIFNKFVFNRNFIIYVKNTLVKTIQVIKFLTTNYVIYSININKINALITHCRKQYLLFNWTPLFKRSSYIWFTTFLKRFTKRK